MKIFLTVGNKNIANKTETLSLTTKLTEQTKILMFMSKVYSYPIKNRKILARKKKTEKMCLQTEKDVLKNKIKKINLQHDVEMFSTNERDIKHLLQNRKLENLKKII